MDMYKFAAQMSLRFPSNRGSLVVEQLFHLPLKSPNGCDLDTIARTIHNELKAMGEESFVEDETANPRKQSLSVSLDVVKDVIATKQEANRSALARLQRAEERRKILDAISTKKDQSLTEATMEDLEKKLAALDV